MGVMTWNRREKEKEKCRRRGSDNSEFKIESLVPEPTEKRKRVI
jgi:hypothetical protein